MTQNAERQKILSAWAVIDDGSCGFEQKYICFKFVIHLCRGQFVQLSSEKCFVDCTYRVSSVDLA